MPCALTVFPRSETGVREFRAGRPEKIPKSIEDFGINGNELASPQPKHSQIRIFG